MSEIPDIHPNPTFLTRLRGELEAQIVPTPSWMQLAAENDRLRVRCAALLDLAEAAQECVKTAAELRRHIHPREGCGYSVYREVWDASFAAENRYNAALARLDTPA